MTSARTDILKEIRGRLRGRKSDTPQSMRVQDGEQDGEPARLERFENQLERACATWASVIARPSVPDAVATYLNETGMPTQIVVAPDLSDVDWGDANILGPSQADYGLDGVVIITQCHYGIAETGTMVSLSGPSLDAKLNFLAETHIVVLDKSKVVSRPEDVWSALRMQEMPSSMPWAVHFITGPSRTADIEQTIELGAHGPRRLHVILVDG